MIIFIEDADTQHSLIYRFSEDIIVEMQPRASEVAVTIRKLWGDEKELFRVTPAVGATLRKVFLTKDAPAVRLVKKEGTISEISAIQ